MSADKDVSATDIIKVLIKYYKMKNILFPIAYNVISKIILIFKKNNFMIKLYYSLRIDNIESKKIMNWKPKFDFNDYDEKN